jgi:hypothetical protein
VFCAHEENIHHLFLDCHYARFLWHAVFFAFGINGPRSVTDMFTTWLHTSGLKQRKQILVDTSALCWTIWTSRNEVIFDKSPTKTYMQVLYRATYWCREWVQLQPCEDDMNDMREACRLLETRVMQLFTNYGWRFSNRLGS